MKLINEQGRFEFIKNGIVEIDKTLPKYSLMEAKREEEKRRLAIATTASSGNIESYYGTPNEASKILDKRLREKIQNMSSDNIKKYLSSADAKEFNESFRDILLGEVGVNSYSVNISNSNWSINELEEFSPLEQKKDRTLLQKIKSFFKKKKKQLKQINEPLRVVDFFDMIHIEVGKEKEFIEKVTGYFKLLDNAYKMKQISQIDAICQKLIVHIYESVLAVHGYNRYIAFSNLENLKNEGKRVIDIDYIANFNRVIPNEVVEKKLKCDDLHVFDNYCVIYYDPTGRTYASTATAKRDPILFGVINHSERLYYIADWEDDLCDLTLDKIAERADIIKEL